MLSNHDIAETFNKSTIYALIVKKQTIHREEVYIFIYLKISQIVRDEKLKMQIWQ